MKATELIKRLQELVDEHGDLDVIFPDDHYAVIGVDDVEKVCETEFMTGDGWKKQQAFYLS